MATICLRIKSGQFLVLVYCPCDKNKDFKLRDWSKSIGGGGVGRSILKCG